MSQVSWTRQFILAVALFTLGTGAFWLEYKHKPEKEHAEEQAKHLFSIQETPVKAVSLQTGSRLLTFTCSDFSSKLCKSTDNSKWEVSEPLKIKGDDTNINSLMSTLGTLSSTDTINISDETPDKRATLLKEYGVDPEARKSAQRVRVQTESGEATLYFGFNHPMGESQFAVLGKANDQVDENHVYLVPGFFKANFDHDLTHWRNKKLFSWGAHDIHSLKLKTPKAELAAEKMKDQWTLKLGKDEFTGDPEKIKSYLSAVTYLVAKNFAAERKTEAKAIATLKGLAEVLRLTLQKEKGDAKESPAPITLTYYQKKSDPSSPLYATLSNMDPLFELDPSAVKRLDKSVNDFRLAQLLGSMERFETKRLELSGKTLGKGSMVLTQSGSQWKSSLDQTAIPGEKIQGILEKIANNKIKEFYSGSSIPGGQAEGIQLTLGDEKTPAKKKLILWKKGDKLYARDLLSQRNEAFLLENNLQGSLPWDSSFFKQKEEKKSDSHSQ